MKDFNLEKLLRPNIRNLKPYSSARHEFTGEAHIFLDANENSFGSFQGVGVGGHHRYPDPFQKFLKEKLAEVKNVLPNQIFIGNGSDEAIDLIIRMFCEPKVDNIIINTPTYGMYKVVADIQDIAVKAVDLEEDFSLNPETVLAQVDEFTKVIFICSPNNPTGNSFGQDNIIQVLESFNGIVVMDEAYIDFSSQASFTQMLSNFPNLIVMQTFSKAWGLAQFRVGMAYASEEIIAIFNKVKAPYNLNGVIEKLTTLALTKESEKNKVVKKILEQREFLEQELKQFPFVKKIYPSDTNFLLLELDDREAIYNFLKKEGIIVRGNLNHPFIKGCLRITIGTETQNQTLLKTLKQYTTN